MAVYNGYPQYLGSELAFPAQYDLDFVQKALSLVPEFITFVGHTERPGTLIARFGLGPRGFSV
jgi:hypothetical protein